MENKRNFKVILAIVVIVALSIQLSRFEFVVKMNRNDFYEAAFGAESAIQNVPEDLWAAAEVRKTLLIVDGSSDVMLGLSENIRNAMTKSGENLQVENVDDVRKIPDTYSAVIYASNDLSQLEPYEDLIRYVEGGGHVLFPFRLEPNAEFYNLYQKVGMIEAGGFIDATGIRLVEDVLIGGKGFEATKPHVMLNSSHGAHLDSGSVLLAESKEGTPLMWERKYGQGKFVYFNGSVLGVKANRGLITGALYRLHEDYIYPVINAKVFFIDDFPAPFPNGMHPKIESEFHRSTPRFFREIWWPDMIDLSKRYDVRYTCVAIGSYSDQTDHLDKEKVQLSQSDLFYYGREIIKNKGELGIHGYNHQPLVTDPVMDSSLGYSPWENDQTMSRSLASLIEHIQSVFPEYRPSVYVPPSNILSAEGRESIKSASDDLRTLSSLYITYDEPDAYEQEFELSEDGIVHLPRLTFGYINSEEIQWVMMNGVTTYGVVSHFVHPGDVLDEVQTGSMGWEALFKDHEAFQKNVHDRYPWLRTMTASEAAGELYRMESSDLKVIYEEDQIEVYINGYSQPQSFVLRTEKSPGSLSNCSIEALGEDAYLVLVSGPVAHIELD